MNELDSIHSFIHSFQDPFNTPMDKEWEVAECKKRLVGSLKSDHLLWAKVLQEYYDLGQTSQRVNQWAWQNFLNISWLLTDFI